MRVSKAAMERPDIVLTEQGRDYKSSSLTSDLKDLRSPGFENWLLEMREEFTTEDWEAGDHEEAKMTYVQNRVGGLEFKHLEPRLRPGCENPVTTGDEMFEVMTQFFAN